jgi:ABC-type lipoprotein release transport system permease subunit
VYAQWGRLSSRQRTILEFVGTLLVLMGILVGILTLRVALVLMHGFMH